MKNSLKLHQPFRSGLACLLLASNLGLSAPVYASDNDGRYQVTIKARTTFNLTFEIKGSGGKLFTNSPFKQMSMSCKESRSKFTCKGTFSSNLCAAGSNGKLLVRMNHGTVGNGTWSGTCKKTGASSARFSVRFAGGRRLR